MEKVARATVGIHSQVPETHVSASIGLGTDRRGTGTLVSSDGLILTVHYMLLGAQSVIVTMVNGDQLPAKIIAKDYSTGLGLLKIEGSNYPRVEVVSAEKSLPGEEDVLNGCVTATKAICRFSNDSKIRAKSSRLRLRRSTLYTTTQSTWPASISARSRSRAGRSMLPPV